MGHVDPLQCIPSGELSSQCARYFVLYCMPICLGIIVHFVVLVHYIGATTSVKLDHVSVELMLKIVLCTVPSYVCLPEAL